MIERGQSIREEVYLELWREELREVRMSNVLVVVKHSYLDGSMLYGSHDGRSSPNRKWRKLALLDGEFVLNI